MFSLNIYVCGSLIVWIGIFSQFRMFSFSPPGSGLSNIICLLAMLLYLCYTIQVKKRGLFDLSVRILSLKIPVVLHCQVA